jgi:hypothetical protein
MITMATEITEGDVVASFYNLAETRSQARHAHVLDGAGHRQGTEVEQREPGTNIFFYQPITVVFAVTDMGASFYLTESTPAMHDIHGSGLSI